jgi:ElaB/YqjD/DUF883 family membrane-anchored ribosome-binding protein
VLRKDVNFPPTGSSRKSLHFALSAQDVYGQAKSAAGEAYGHAKEAAGDAARSVREHAAPVEEFLRNAIESRPYTSVAVALGIGWSIGRMGGGHSDYWER